MRLYVLDPSSHVLRSITMRREGGSQESTQRLLCGNYFFFFFQTTFTKKRNINAIPTRLHSFSPISRQIPRETTNSHAEGDGDREHLHPSTYLASQVVTRTRLIEIILGYHHNSTRMLAYIEGK